MFAEAIDDSISNLFQTYTGMDISSWLTFAKEQVQLPIRLKGCGLRGAVDRRNGQYIRATVQSIMQIIGREDGMGSIIASHLNVPTVVNLFRADSFDHPYPSPGLGVLTNIRLLVNIAYELQFFPSHLNTNFQAVVTHEQVLDQTSLLLKQDVKRAGFYADGTIAASISITMAITMELKRQREMHFGE